MAEVAQFTAAIRRVAGGESVIDPEAVARLVARPRADSQLWMSPKTVETMSGVSSASSGWPRRRGLVVLAFLRQ